jgi:Rod binding domain-containing protein
MTSVTYARPIAPTRPQFVHAKRPAPAAAPANLPGAPVQPQSAGMKAAGDAQLHEAFSDFVGETFYGQMMQSLRKSVPKSSRFHGGRGEEVFSRQLDQMLAQKMGKTHGDRLSDSMYRLFSARRK